MVQEEHEQHQAAGEGAGFGSPSFDMDGDGVRDAGDDEGVSTRQSELLRSLLALASAPVAQPQAGMQGSVGGVLANGGVPMVVDPEDSSAEAGEGHSPPSDVAV